MESMPEQPWTDAGADELEASVINDEEFLLLLAEGSAARFGGTRGSDFRRGGVRVRIGRKPTVHNLRALYRRKKHGVPEEFDVFWSHEIWMLHHTVGLLADGGVPEVRSLQYDLMLDPAAIIQGVAPDERIVRDSVVRPECRASVLLNGRMTPEIEERGSAELENLSGGAFVSSERDDVVGRVWLPMWTSEVRVIGPGCNIATWSFRSDRAIEGYQPMATTFLLDKYVRTIECRMRVRLHATGRNGVTVPIGGSGWANITVSLDPQSQGES